MRLIIFFTNTQFVKSRGFFFFRTGMHQGCLITSFVLTEKPMSLWTVSPVIVVPVRDHSATYSLQHLIMYTIRVLWSVHHGVRTGRVPVHQPEVGQRTAVITVIQISKGCNSTVQPNPCWRPVARKHKYEQLGRDIDLFFAKIRSRIIYQFLSC